MALDEVQFVRLEASVHSLAESIVRFEKATDTMAAKMETANYRRDEALGDNARRIDAIEIKMKDMPQQLKVLEEWKAVRSGKSDLMRALPGTIASILSAAAAAFAFAAYFSI